MAKFRREILLINFETIICNNKKSSKYGSKKFSKPTAFSDKTIASQIHVVHVEFSPYLPIHFSRRTVVFSLCTLKFHSLPCHGVRIRFWGTKKAQTQHVWKTNIDTSATHGIMNIQDMKLCGPVQYLKQSLRSFCGETIAPHKHTARR